VRERFAWNEVVMKWSVHTNAGLLQKIWLSLMVSIRRIILPISAVMSVYSLDPSLGYSVAASQAREFIDIDRTLLK
jgi:hypothetical protein